MKKRIGLYLRVRVEGDGRGVVTQAGAVLLVETVRKSGLDTAMSVALAPLREARAVHDPGKILRDVALAVALGGDCLADVAVLRAEPALFGPVASVIRRSPVWSTHAPQAASVLWLRSGRPGPKCANVWRLAGDAVPDAEGQLIVDLDGVLVIVHSDKQDAATWKKTGGHHPLMGFLSTTATAVRRTHRGTAAARQRRFQHRCRYRGHQGGLGPAAQEAPARTADADPN